MLFGLQTKRPAGACRHRRRRTAARRPGPPHRGQDLVPEGVGPVEQGFRFGSQVVGNRSGRELCRWPGRGGRAGSRVFVRPYGPGEGIVGCFARGQRELRRSQSGSEGVERSAPPPPALDRDEGRAHATTPPIGGTPVRWAGSFILPSARCRPCWFERPPIVRWQQRPPPRAMPRSTVRATRCSAAPGLAISSRWLR